MTGANSGLSLIELLVSLAIVGLILGAGVPAIGGIVAKQEVRSAHARLFRHLSMARQEAVNLGQQTVICPSTDGLGCSGGTQWRDGWLSFVDLNRNRLRDPGELALGTGLLPARVSVITSRARRAIRFLPNGGSPGSNLTFVICPTSGADPQAIILSNAGRARSSLTLANGKPLICA